MIHTCTLEQLRVVGIKCCIQGVSNKMSLYEMGEDRNYFNSPSLSMDIMNRI